jgi:acyl transferase domain-containing protein/thioesterase domain-containing protein/acyl carrier protein
MKTSAIAIIGMAGRFPGARTVTEFWQNLHDGVESIRQLSEAELLAAGVTPGELANGDYVRAAAILDDVAMFDASFFGFSPRDASIMDPQHRHFLEAAWEALEDAGHPPQSFEGSIGVYAGSGMNSYLIHNLLANRRLRESAGLFQLKQTGNDKDVLSTRVSYHLNLRGPSINVQTACSTSLVAIHLACQSLLDQECDMALAGGVTIEIPHGRGYIFREGEILSRDGHCRSFDAASSGTVFASGLGIVVLRRLEDALADRDNIRAIILGSAINNDGARKVGYLAPSVEGQAEVIAEALAVAGVTAEDIFYVETHGTGTAVGDPIEIRALTQAFRHSGARRGYCGIGSLKTNVGHLDAAAGVAGLIKTVLSLEHRQLPATLHFQTPNPLIEFKDSPFFVNSRLMDWPDNGEPRRAGVTSLGIGGTNAHVVVQEAPPLERTLSARPCHLLTVSARTEPALKRACANLAGRLREGTGLDLGDVAFTCQLGRQAFSHRYTTVAQNPDEAIKALTGRAAESAAGAVPNKAPGVAFLFSGQGSQYVNMGRELYETEPGFRDALDGCSKRLQPHLGFDLLRVLYPPESEIESSRKQLGETWLTQPALFALEYSLAQWWLSLGIKPQAMVGHSIGEYVAACLAGVLRLEHALEITAFRGRLISQLPPGSMLAVPLPPEEVPLSGSLSIAAINHPRQCVVSGSNEEIAKLEERLAQSSISCRRLQTSHAFHSAMMDPILDRFAARMQAVALSPPKIPYLSNVTGTWIRAEEATDPGYWILHLRRTVRFSECLHELFREPGRIALEVGPGQVLASLARQQCPAGTKVFQSLRHPQEAVPALRFALRTLGDIWAAGAEVDFSGLHRFDSARRVSLPTYPFEHRPFWVEPDVAAPALPASLAPSSVEEDRINKWFYRRDWIPAALENASFDRRQCFLLFSDAGGFGARVASDLKAKGQRVLIAEAGSCYQRHGAGSYTIRPNVRSDYDALIADLIDRGSPPEKIIHLWSAVPGNSKLSVKEKLERSFYSVLFLIQALAAQDSKGIEVAIVSNRMQSVAGEPLENPVQATVLGPVRVLPKELPDIASRAIDIDLTGSSGDECASHIVAEVAASSKERVIAYRQGRRYSETLARLDLSITQPRLSQPESGGSTGQISKPRLSKRGVYLLTGGLGGVGLAVAEHLAREFQARLILVGRSPFPPETAWDSCLKADGEAEATKQKIRKLRELRVLGAELLVLRADVTDIKQVRNVLDQGKTRFGEINGVFHAAGVIDDGPLMLKTAESAASVLDSKVHGTLALEEALRGTPLSCFVLFSSISSFRPPPGQVDYSAANAFLDAFALSRGGTLTAIDWDFWRDGGMGATPLHPLIDRRLNESQGERTYTTRMSQQHHWILAEHRLKSGKAIFPGTGYLEMAAAAFDRGAPRAGIEFDDVFFLEPLLFDASEYKDVRVRIRHDGSDVRFSILVWNGKWTEHSTGGISRAVSKRPPRLDRKEISARCRQVEIAFDDHSRTRQERYLDFGPRWRSLNRLRLGTQECLAELELKEPFVNEDSLWRIHPALLDMATGCALYLIPGYLDSQDLYLPVSYRRLRSYGQIPSKVYSHIRYRRGSPGDREMAVFDITLFDEQGEVVVDAEGLTMRRLAEPSTGANISLETPSGRSTTEAPEAPEDFSIPTLDGTRALRRILAGQIPQVVVVSPQDLMAAERPVPEVTRDTKAVPPLVGELENALSSWWRELLGIEDVGLDDDFFALGGHSLIAVRLLAKVKKVYGVDLGLATLFQARTVRHLSTLIRSMTAPLASGTAIWSPLVPIQPGGSKPPLFLVHGLGPSLLFYEKLAAHLGPDQPVYALQSPWISENQTPPETLEGLASLYVQEVRRLLPEGPYLLGGASLGGLIAAEMSQQLYASGRKPDILLLFDTFVPGSHQHLGAGAQILQHWQNFRKAGFPYLFARSRDKIEFLWSRGVRAISLDACRCYGLLHKPLPAGLRYLPVEEAHKRAMRYYQVQVYPGKVTLFRAMDFHQTAATRRNPSLGWDKYAAGGLEIHNVRGEHNSMFREPHVRDLAEKVNAVLSQVTILAATAGRDAGG